VGEVRQLGGAIEDARRVRQRSRHTTSSARIVVRWPSEPRLTHGDPTPAEQRPCHGTHVGEAGKLLEDRLRRTHPGTVPSESRTEAARTSSGSEQGLRAAHYCRCRFTLSQAGWCLAWHALS
jgi:hypothetical protein